MEFMNLLKYDAMTFGNHEFDLGGSSDGHLGFTKFIKAADFPSVSLIVRTLNLTAEGTATYTDISKVAAETQAEIAVATKAGIVKGSNGKFLPNQSVTRAQFALMLNRAYDSTKAKPYKIEKEASFIDYGKHNQEVINAITMLNELNIASGSNGKFNPNEGTTRAQAAKMISNFSNELK